MRIISSTIRPKIRKVFSTVMAILATGGTLLILYLLIFRVIKPEKLTPFIISVLFFLLWGSFAYFKKREVVYIDKNNFVIRGKKILITDVISIDKRFRKPEYIVRYYGEDGQIDSFILEIDQIINTPPEFMTKLIALAAKNNHDTSLL